MRGKRTGEKSASRATTDWRRLRSLSDRQIRRAVEADTEARATDTEFWKNARVVLPRPKQAITIHLDADLLEWLRRQRGYQTRINAVLRSYMRAQADRTGSSPHLDQGGAGDPARPRAGLCHEVCRESHDNH